MLWPAYYDLIGFIWSIKSDAHLLDQFCYSDGGDDDDDDYGGSHCDDGGDGDYDENNYSGGGND